MTNIYLEFTSGQTTVRKQREMAAFLGITIYLLLKLINKRLEGTFEHEGKVWNFKTINANLVPKPRKTNIDTPPLTVSKVIGQTEVFYSAISGRLLFSRALKI